MTDHKTWCRFMVGDSLTDAQFERWYKFQSAKPDDDITKFMFLLEELETIIQGEPNGN